MVTSLVTAFIARRWSIPESRLQVELQPLHGGLESAVARARISVGGGGTALPADVVVKHLPSGFAREADVYQALWQHLERRPAVQVFGRDTSGDTTSIYLEHATPLSSWPWADSALAARVCRALARLHDNRDLPRETFAWNYEEQLTRSAGDTLALLRRPGMPQASGCGTESATCGARARAATHPATAAVGGHHGDPWRCASRKRHPAPGGC
jgi:hypothetical protein